MRTRLAVVVAALIGIAAGFYLGQGYGYLQVGCAFVQARDDPPDLPAIVSCAGGMRPLIRFLITREPSE